MAMETRGDVGAPLLVPYHNGGGGGGSRKGSPWLPEIARQYRIAGPMIVTSFLSFLFPLIALAFVGHIGELELAAAALANSFSSVTGQTLMVGLASGLETLCGQAYGAGQYHMLGIHLQAATLILLILAVPITFLWLNIGPVFILLGQSKDISTMAANYFQWLVPLLYANAFLSPLLKFLQTQSIVLPTMLCSLFALLIHIPMCYFLVYKSGMGFLGGALAISLTYWLNLIVLVLYVVLSNSCNETWKGISREAFGVLKIFLKAAIPACIMICLEYWSFEILVLLSGILPNPALQTSILAVCVNTEGVYYMFPLGLSAAVSTRVSNELGAGNVEAAKFSVRVSVALASIQAVLFAALFLAVRNSWGGIFSSDAVFVHAIGNFIPLLAATLLLDGLQGVLAGIARGCGWQDIGAYINLGAFYGFGMPIGLVLTFVLKLGAKGLWGGLTCGLFLQTFVLLIVTWRINWSKMADEAMERTHAEASLN